MLSPEDLKKERNRVKNKNKYKRDQLTKKIEAAELQIEEMKRERAKLTFAQPSRPTRSSGLKR